MDISRIEAYNPNKINWKNLTAKEILKYQKQGVEVPDVYVQWAQEFLRNVQKYDTDEVTYEKDQSITRHQSNEAKADRNSRDGKNIKIEDLNKPKEEEEQASEADGALALENANISTDSAEAESISTDSGTEAIQLTAAQTKRKDFQDKGVGLREQAISFAQDSQTSGNQASSEISTLKSIESSSNNEIAELEIAMKELIAEADAKQQELRQNVDIINNEKSNSSTFAKIEKLQKELEQLGMSGQNEIAQTEGSLRSYSSDINARQTIMLNAGDFGAETVDVGNELVSTTGEAWWFNIDRMIGQKAVNAGNNAIRKSQEGENALNSANDANNSNIGKVPALKTDVSDKTGIDAKDAKNQGNASEQDPITGKTKESDKDIKTSSNDGTDTTDKLHLNIDEILKRKVRRGEYAQES